MLDHKTYEYEPSARVTFQAYKKCNLTSVSRFRHARSPQRVALDRAKTQSHLHFAPSTRGCAEPGKNVISLAFRAFNTHDLRRRLHRTKQKRNLTCISCLRRARSPQRVVRAKSKTQSHLHFAPSRRTISAEGRAGHSKNAISPAFRALDARDLRRGLTFAVLRRHHPRLKKELKEEREDPRCEMRRCEDEQRCRCADVRVSNDVDVQM